MALITTLVYLAVTVFLLLLAIAFGVRWLQRLQLMPSSKLEGALYAAGVSFSLLALAVFVLGMLGWLHRWTALALILGMTVFAGRGWLWLRNLANASWCFLLELKQSPERLIVVILITGFLGLDAFMAMAPLTGSDAMHYHFTAPKIWVESGFRPIFWLMHSFLTGQGHMLIALGLVLGSDRISLGLIYIAGVLTSAALFLLARKLMSMGWALLVVLTFVLTPMVFWQISVSGAPDIWMAFYTILAVQAAVRGVKGGEWRWLALSGFYAGAAAAVKYTGWIIPIVLVFAIIAATRSIKLGNTFLFFSLFSGVYPLLRNILWTGDPFFPFLTAWIIPESINRYTITSYLSGTRASGFQTDMVGFFRYPLLIVLKGDAYGVGHYFGPIILAFAPLLVFVPWRNSLLVRFTGVLWIGVFLSNALTSQMGRFLLPVFPIALALVFAGTSKAIRKSHLVRVGCYGTLLAFYLFAVGSQILYARDFMPVVLGQQKQEIFLDRMAPDYQAAAFINSSLEGQDGKVMVFFRHLYYLRVPFIYAHPSDSLLMNPKRYNSPEHLLALFHQYDIRWVVKAPGYPEAFVQAFERLEAEGWLQPVAQAEVKTFAGWRIYGRKEQVPVVILKVVDKQK